MCTLDVGVVLGYSLILTMVEAGRKLVGSRVVLLQNKVMDLLSFTNVVRPIRKSLYIPMVVCQHAALKDAMV